MRISIIFWLIYLFIQTCIEYIWIGKSYESWPNVNVFILAIAVESILLIPKIIFNYGVIRLTKDFEKFTKLSSKWIYLLSLFILSVVLYRILSLFVILPYLYNENDINYFNILRLLIAMFDVITPVALFTTIRLFRLQIEQLQKEKSLIKNKLETELNFLKTQTNPHFLFNSLNNIYGIARKHDKESAQSILQLSEILRYILHGSQKKQCNLTEELELIKNYIHLEELRYKDKLILVFENNIASNDAKIVPMLLLPVIENAFKYGASESIDQAKITINLNVDTQNKLVLRVENTFEKVDKSEYSGIGYKNLKRILELSYKEYDFIHYAHQSVYITELKINLNSYENI